MPERNTCHHQGRAGHAATRNEHPEGAPWMLSSAGIRCHLRGDTLRQVLLAQSRLIAVTEQGSLGNVRSAHGFFYILDRCCPEKQIMSRSRSESELFSSSA